MIDLTKNELLVLFEFLYRFSETDTLAFSHHSEAVVLDHIGAILERSLPEPFKEDYPQVLQKARSQVFEQYEKLMGKDTWIHQQPTDQT